MTKRKEKEKEKEKVSLVIIASGSVKKSPIVREWLKLTEEILNSELERLTKELRSAGVTYHQLPTLVKG